MNPSFPIATIAAFVGAIFLLAAIYKGFRSRAESRRLADERSAALTGGTPEEPVHLKSPFAQTPDDIDQPSVDTPPEDPPYVWE